MTDGNPPTGNHKSSGCLFVFPMIETHLIGIVKTIPIARDLDGQKACRFKVALPTTAVQDELELYCEAFGKDAATLIKFLRKGEGLYILGDLGTRSYHNGDGEFLAPLVARVGEFRFLGAIKPSAAFLRASAKGNLGTEPVKQTTDNGLAVCEFDIAVRDYRQTPDGKNETTTWMTVKTWNGKAEACYEHLTKGSKVEVRGSHIRSKTWKTEAGEDRADLRLTARYVEFLDRRIGQAAAPDDDDEMPWE